MEEFIKSGLLVNKEGKIILLGPLAHNCTYKIIKGYLTEIGIREFLVYKSKNKGKNKNCFAMIKFYKDHEYVRVMSLTHFLMGKRAYCKDLLRTDVDLTMTKKELFGEADYLQRRVYFYNPQFERSCLALEQITSTMSIFGLVQEAIIEQVDSLSDESPCSNYSEGQIYVNTIRVYGFVLFSTTTERDEALACGWVNCHGVILELRSASEFIEELIKPLYHNRIYISVQQDLSYLQFKQSKDSSIPAPLEKICPKQVEIPNKLLENLNVLINDPTTENQGPTNKYLNQLETQQTPGQSQRRYSQEDHHSNLILCSESHGYTHDIVQQEFHQRERGQQQAFNHSYIRNQIIHNFSDSHVKISREGQINFEKNEMRNSLNRTKRLSSQEHTFSKTPFVASFAEMQQLDWFGIPLYYRRSMKLLALQNQQIYVPQFQTPSVCPYIT